MATKRTHNGILAQILAGLFHRPCAIQQMHTVKTKPLNQLDVAVYDQGHVAGVRHLAQGIGGACDAVFVTCRQRKTDTCHISPIQTGGQLIRKYHQINIRGRDQVKLGHINGVGHGLCFRYGGVLRVSSGDWRGWLCRKAKNLRVVASQFASAYQAPNQRKMPPCPATTPSLRSF